MTAVLVILYHLEATPLWRFRPVTFTKFCKEARYF